MEIKNLLNSVKNAESANTDVEVYEQEDIYEQIEQENNSTERSSIDVLFEIAEINDRQRVVLDSDYEYNYNFLCNVGINQLIIGRDGVGKTSFAISQLIGYCNYIRNVLNIVPIYIDSDDKNAKQRKKFSRLLKDSGGVYLNYYESIESNQAHANGFELFLFNVIRKLDNNKYYYILVDNWSNIIAGDETDTKIIASIIEDMNKLILKKQNITFTLIAHTGKDQSKGVRGSSALRAPFGQELLIQEDVKSRKVVSITKDSDGNFANISKSYYVDIDYNKMIFKLKESNIKTYEKEQLMSYRFDRLHNVVASLLYQIRFELKAIAVKASTFKAIVAIIGSMDNEGKNKLDSDNVDYLNPTFIRNNLPGLLDKFNIKLIRDKRVKEFYYDLSGLPKASIELFEFIDFSVNVTVNELLEKDDTSLVQQDSVEKDNRLDLLKEDIVEILKSGSFDTMKIREQVYKVAENTDRYSKNFIFNSIAKVLKDLVKDNIVSVKKDGRKKVFTLNK